MVTDDSGFKLFELIGNQQIFEQGDTIYRDMPFSTENNRLFRMNIRLDPVKNIHIRSVQSMLEFLGDMGGLIQIVFLFAWGFVAYFVERNFKAAIISDMQQLTFKNRKILKYPHKKLKLL